MNKYRNIITSHRTNSQFIERFKGKISLINKTGNLETINCSSPVKRLPHRLPSLELNVPYNFDKQSKLLLNREILNCQSKSSVRKNSPETNLLSDVTKGLKTLSRKARNAKSLIYSESVPTHIKLKMPFTCHYNLNAPKPDTNTPCWNYIGKKESPVHKSIQNTYKDLSKKPLRTYRRRVEFNGVNDIWVKYPCFYSIKK